MVNISLIVGSIATILFILLQTLFKLAFLICLTIFSNKSYAVSSILCFSKGIFEWVGFKTEWITYENIERVAGKTKWSFWGLFKYSLECIVAFSTAPLAISSFCGFFMFLVSIIGALVIVIRKIIDSGSSVGGWASTVCVILFVGGLQLLCIGVLGQYLSKTYMETKRRPDYIVAETEEDKTE